MSNKNLFISIILEVPLLEILVNHKQFSEEWKAYVEIT